MIAADIRTSSDLRMFVESFGHESHFFDRKTMRFFGDTMRNYGVRRAVEVTTQSGEKLRAFELYRRRPVKHGLRGSAWFCAETFRRVFPATDNTNN